MVVYSTFLDKENKSHQILCYVLIDDKGWMNITFSIPIHLIEWHEQKIIQGRSISITNFIILPKTIYDRGNNDKIFFSMNQAS